MCGNGQRLGSRGLKLFRLDRRIGSEYLPGARRSHENVTMRLSATREGRRKSERSVRDFGPLAVGSDLWGSICGLGGGGG